MGSYALILTGDIGINMGNIDKPKQFMEVYGKPIISYTLETFSIHPEIVVMIRSCKSFSS